MRPIAERYNHDPVFRRLVDTLEQMLLTLQTTPTEIREACMLAQLHYERLSLRPVRFTLEELRRLGVQVVGEDAPHA